MDTQVGEALASLRMLTGLAVGLSGLTLLVIAVDAALGFLRSTVERRLVPRGAATVLFEGDAEPLSDLPFHGDGYGPVTMYDWTAYGHHLTDCDQCGQEHARCDVGMAIYAEAKANGMIVTGEGR